VVFLVYDKIRTKFLMSICKISLVTATKEKALKNICFAVYF
jgi:hypothetical protein